jgi:hypothetical protein
MWIACHTGNRHSLAQSLWHLFAVVQLTSKADIFAHRNEEVNKMQRPEKSLHLKSVNYEKREID